MGDGRNYPHMCRDGHEEIGWRGEAERCPLCISRDTVRRLNRRVQSAESGLAAKMESGPSFGRALANSAATMYRSRLAAVEESVRRFFVEAKDDHHSAMFAHLLNLLNPAARFASSEEPNEGSAIPVPIDEVIAPGGDE